MTEKEIKALIERYIAGTCSPEEKIFLEHWYADELKKRTPDVEKGDSERIKDEIWERIVDERSQIVKRRVAWSVWGATAAAILLIGIFVVYQRQKWSDRPIVEQEVANTVTEVSPGGNKAILTMGNGKRFILTDEDDGVLEQGEGFVIRKQQNGVVSFEIVDDPKHVASILNTIETPIGGIYQVVLPDGSNVWLNSASSISFPSNFSPEERRVAIQGEVYFEIERDESRPFRVDAPQQQIEVLGTKFNINAYNDEPYVRTSLIAGSVKVKGSGKEKVLKPGFQMITTKNGKDRIGEADIEAIIAWKEGIFQFERVELEVLMRQLARWYDVDIVYQGAYPKDEFVGRIRRDEDIWKVISVLQYGNVDVSLEGRKLMVGHKK